MRGCNLIEINSSLIIRFNLSASTEFPTPNAETFFFPSIEITICRYNITTGTLEDIPGAPCSTLTLSIETLTSVSGSLSDPNFIAVNGYIGIVSGIVCLRPGDLLVPCIRNLAVVNPDAIADDIDSTTATIAIGSDYFINKCTTINIYKVGNC